ncbi:MAG: hypothetical protein KDD62_11450, partial [Bdellovibrionales bacterium]|nr:hypothetical protein [Bdellovibrionales bacterium]
MFSDPVLNELVLHHWSKIGLGVVLLIAVWLFVQRSIIPWWKKTTSQEGNDSNANQASFPFVSTVLLATLCFGYVYYITM